VSSEGAEVDEEPEVFDGWRGSSESIMRSREVRNGKK
jgi:hypothetical protein